MSSKSDKIFFKTLSAHDGFARTKDLLAAGVHRRDIKRIRDEGRIVSVKRGLYRRADIPLISHQGFIDLAHAVPEGVICLLSALSYHELTTFNPSVISMSLRRGSRKPIIKYPPVDFYHFSEEQFEAGIDEVTIGGHKVRIYCREKTVCDCFRYRNKLGLDVAKEGLTEYLKRKDRDLEKLMKYAEVCRIKSLLSIWLSALV